MADSYNSPSAGSREREDESPQVAERAKGSRPATEKEGTVCIINHSLSPPPQQKKTDRNKDMC